MVRLNAKSPQRARRRYEPVQGVGLADERGTHDDLLAQDGLYATLWAVQAGETDPLRTGESTLIGTGPD